MFQSKRKKNGMYSFGTTPPGSSGTVTSVSVTTANGVSGSVANPTTTPAISLTLGAITPSSVNSVVLSGSATPTLAVTGASSISGTNTGNQTITLTGDVTGSGTGSFAATIANSAVTYAKMQNVSATDKILGRSTAGAGVVEEITCTSFARSILDDVDAAAVRATIGAGTGAGSVTSASVVSANGFAGTVATATTTPAITLTTTIIGILSGNGTAISAASTTGSGSVVLATGPVLSTPTLGVATATSINKVAITAPATSATLTLADGSTLATSGAFSTTLTATGSTNVTLPTSGTLVNTAVTTLSSLASIGTVTTGTWNATTVDVSHGGTGATSETAYAVLCGGTTSTGAFQSIASVGTSGQVLTSNGAGALPTFQASGASLSANFVSATYGANTATGTQTIAHGLGATPTKITIRADYTKSGNNWSSSNGSWKTGGVYANSYVQINGTADSNRGTSTSQIIRIEEDIGDTQIATVSSVDGTNITLSWTKTGTITNNNIVMFITAYA